MECCQHAEWSVFLSAAGWFVHGNEAVVIDQIELILLACSALSMCKYQMTMNTQRYPIYPLHDLDMRHSYGHPNVTSRGIFSYFFFMITVGMIFSSCSTPTPIADEIVFGAEPDVITARVDGSPMTFEVNRGTKYFGIHTSGVSGENSIILDLGYGSPGKFLWVGERSFMSAESAASLNGAAAIKGLGYLNIILNERACVSGTFEFTTINPVTKDTIRVSDGTFRVHYITTD